MWSFSGESEQGVTPLTTGIDPVQPYQNVDFDAAKAALESGASLTPGRSNVYDALKVVADNMVATGIHETRQPTIILFTDGPDDSVTVLPAASQSDIDAGVARSDAKLDAALASVKAAGAEVIIVHLDESLVRGGDGVAATRPDPLTAQRHPRDGHGRFGPLDVYARIACETGGHYLYSDSATGLQGHFSRIPTLLEGSWQVDMGAEALGQITEKGAYRLGGTLGVELDGQKRTYELSADPLNLSPDSRLVYFKH